MFDKIEYELLIKKHMSKDLLQKINIILIHFTAYNTTGNI